MIETMRRMMAAQQRDHETAAQREADYLESVRERHARLGCDREPPPAPIRAPAIKLHDTGEPPLKSRIGGNWETDVGGAIPAGPVGPAIPYPPYAHN